MSDGRKKLKQTLALANTKAAFEALEANWENVLMGFKAKAKIMKAEYDSYRVAGFNEQQALILCKLNGQIDEKNN